MKRIFVLIAPLLLMMYSCDKVDNPYPEDFSCNSGNGSSSIGTMITNSIISTELASDAVTKSILLEDYTGFKCTNCPDAHEVAQDIRDTYGDQVKIMALHVTDVFAAPTDGTVYPDPFSQDFRTEAGEIYVSQFGVFALPSGLINRNSSNGFYTIPFASWETEIDARINEMADIRMDIFSAHYSEDTLKVNFDIEFLEALDGDYYVTINLVENELTSAQYTTGEVEYDYLQKDVFRGTLNGVYGELVNSDPQDMDLHIVEGNYFLPGNSIDPNTPNPDIEIEDCHIIIYVYKSDFDNGIFDIYQVASAEVTF